jgi:hypothetical protein
MVENTIHALFGHKKQVTPDATDTLKNFEKKLMVSRIRKNQIITAASKCTNRKSTQFLELSKELKTINTQIGNIEKNINILKVSNINLEDLKDKKLVKENLDNILVESKKILKDIDIDKFSSTIDDNDEINKDIHDINEIISNPTPNRQVATDDELLEELNRELEPNNEFSDNKGIIEVSNTIKQQEQLDDDIDNNIFPSIPKREDKLLFPPVPKQNNKFKIYKASGNNNDFTKGALF